MSQIIPADGGGGLVLIGTVVGSNDASIAITGLDTTYETYRVIGDDLVPQTDAVDGWLRFGDSAGVDSGAGDYRWWANDDAYNTAIAGTATAAPTYDRDDADAQIKLFGAAHNGVGNAANEGLGFDATLHNPQGDVMPMISGKCDVIDGGTVLRTSHFGGSHTTNITMDRIQFLFSSGNIVSGRMTVFGVKHA